MVTVSATLRALVFAVSTSSALAKATPMRRFPATVGLPNRRSDVSGCASASFKFPNSTWLESPSTRMTVYRVQQALA